jgi:DNA-binding LacI/PurR family transcriptional regulator
MRSLPDTPSLLSQAGNLYFVFSKYPSDQNSYHAEVLCYIQDMMEKNAWQLKICLAQDGQSLVNALNDPMNIGIIHDSSCGNLFSNDDDGPACIEYGMSPYSIGITGVYPDNLSGGFEAGCHVFEFGHSRVKYITADPGVEEPFSHYHFSERYNGLCEAGRRYNIPVPPPVAWNIRNEETHKGVKDILNMIEAKAPDAPTALIVGNKSMASEIYLMATGMGLRIPDNLSMVTFIERPGSEQFPITTYDISGKAIAMEVINLLERYYANTIVSPLKILLPMTLNEMNSVKDLTAGI